MKFKSLLLSAAIAATTFSGVANAAIDGPTSTGASVNSDLVLFVYDTVKDLSYVQNLNVNYKDIIGLNGSFSGSYGLDASALNVFSTSTTSDLVWGLASSGLDFNDADGSTLGSVLTANNPGAAPSDYALVAAVNGKFNDLAVAANTTAIGTANAADATGAAASALSTAVKGFYSQVGNQVGFTNSASVTAAQSLWFVHLNADYDVSAPSLASANTWALNLGAATLNSAAAVVVPPVAPVPLPAAAWLMFSALMGLGGIARRRNAKV